jgi:hypothetical protein
MNEKKRLGDSRSIEAKKPNFTEIML